MCTLAMYYHGDLRARCFTARCISACLSDHLHAHADAYMRSKADCHLWLPAGNPQPAARRARHTSLADRQVHLFVRGHCSAVQVLHPGAVSLALARRVMYAYVTAFSDCLRTADDCQHMHIICRKPVARRNQLPHHTHASYRLQFPHVAAACLKHMCCPRPQETADTDEIHPQTSQFTSVDKILQFGS